MTAAERKAAERQRRKDAGLVRVEAWVPAEHADAVRGGLAQIIRAMTQPEARNAVRALKLLIDE